MRISWEMVSKIGENIFYDIKLMIFLQKNPLKIRKSELVSFVEIYTMIY